MSIKKICDIIGNGNEYFTGTEIMDQLHKAGYVVAPRKPNKAMIERGQMKPATVYGCAWHDANTLTVHETILVLGDKSGPGMWFGAFSEGADDESCEGVNVKLDRISIERLHKQLGAWLSSSDRSLKK